MNVYAVMAFDEVDGVCRIKSLHRTRNKAVETAKVLQEQYDRWEEFNVEFYVEEMELEN